MVWRCACWGVGVWHVTLSQVLKDFREKFCAPEGYRMTTVARQHLEEYRKAREWRYKPKTKEQLEQLYASASVAENVMRYLRAHHMCKFSEMHQCELFDHPETELVVTSSSSKSKSVSEKSSVRNAATPQLRRICVTSLPATRPALRRTILRLPSLRPSTCPGSPSSSW